MICSYSLRQTATPRPPAPMRRTMPRYASGASRSIALQSLAATPATMNWTASQRPLPSPLIRRSIAAISSLPRRQGPCCPAGGRRRRTIRVRWRRRTNDRPTPSRRLRPAGPSCPGKTSRNAPGMTQDLPDRPVAPGACVSDRENREPRKRAVRPSCFDRARESLRPPGRRAAMSLAPSRVARSAVVPPRGRSAPYLPVRPGVPLGCRIPLLSRKGGLRCASAGRSTRAVDRRGFAKTGNGPDRIRGRLQRRRIVATWPARR